MERTKAYLQNTDLNLAYPGVTNDKLYQAFYLRRHCLPNSCAICHEIGDKICETATIKLCRDLGYDESKLDARERNQAPWKPSIHFGRIGSGDFVLKSGGIVIRSPLERI